MPRWEDLEFSSVLSRPVNLYEFAIRRDGYWEYHRYSGTKKTEQFTTDSWEGASVNDFTPEHISHGRMKQNFESVYDIDLEVTVPKENAIAKIFRGTSPQRTVWLKIFSAQRGSSDVKAIWVGRIRHGELISGTATKLLAEPIGTMVKRGGLRMNCQTMCNHFLYSPACGISVTDPNFTLPSCTIQNGSKLEDGIIICDQLATKENEWFKHGFIELNDHFYMVTYHQGSKIKLFNPVENGELGQVFSISAGCDHEFKTGCMKKFKNHINFGGFPWMPDDDPYTTGVGI